MNLLKATGTIGGLTLASRILGLVRDSLFARYVGASFASDAFLVAFRLPNMFRALFAEGAFAAAFIPMFNQKVSDPEGPGLPAGIVFAEQALSVLLPTLLVMTALLEIFAWPVTFALSGRFHGVTPDQFAFAVKLSRLTIPYLMLISIVSLLGGILNSLHKFWVNAAAPILLNLTLILAMLLFHSHDPLITARNQALAVSVSGGFQLIWLAHACWRNGVSLRPRWPRLTPDVSRLMTLIWPAAAGSGAVQINLVISTALAASLLDHGSVTYIYMADRLNQLPLGLIGIGLGTVLLPTISRQLGAGFYARQDTKTPVRYAMLSMLVNLALNLALIVPLRHMGPPLATAIASTVNVAMLYITLTRRGHFKPDARLRRRAPRLALAALAMGAVLWLFEGRLMPYTHGSWLVRFLTLSVLVGAGTLVYGLATIVLGAFTRDDIALLRRRSPTSD